MALYLQNLKRPITGTYTMSSRMSSMLSDNKHVSVAGENTKELHISSKQEYPLAQPLPLPLNIDPTEATRFSPQRARDITSTVISTNMWNQRHIDITVDATPNYTKSGFDPHVDSYDCQNAVSLNSAMQSNVPSPFSGTNTHYMHLNMPGGQWSQQNKWMSHGLNASHYINLRLEARKKWNNSDIKEILNSQLNATPNNLSLRNYSTDNKAMVKKDDKTADKAAEVISSDSNKGEEVNGPLTAREKLKKAIKDYGATVLVFHIAISIVSLGFFYQLVSSGIDMVAVLEYIGWGPENSALSSNMTSGAGTFVVAYSIHKVFAPLRIGITLASAPFIVRFLRARGILSKTPKKP